MFTWWVNLKECSILESTLAINSQVIVSNAQTLCVAIHWLEPDSGWIKCCHIFVVSLFTKHWWSCCLFAPQKNSKSSYKEMVLFVNPWRMFATSHLGLKLVPYDQTRIEHRYDYRGHYMSLSGHLPPTQNLLRNFFKPFIECFLGHHFSLFSGPCYDFKIPRGHPRWI